MKNNHGIFVRIFILLMLSSCSKTETIDIKLYCVAGYECTSHGYDLRGIDGVMLSGCDNIHTSAMENDTIYSATNIMIRNRIKNK